MIQQFLLQLADQKKPLSLPQTFTDIYAETVKQLLKKYPDAKKGMYSLDDGSPKVTQG